MIKKVTDFLDNLGISYTLLRHPAVVTTEESHRVVHVPNCASCKSLYVKDKKSDNFYMLVLSAEKRADMRKLANCVGCAKFEFASEEVLFEHLCVHRGSVSPFAFLNESPENSAPLLIDRDVWQSSNVKFHPCDNTATVVLKMSDFRLFLQTICKEVVVVDA